MTLFLIAMAAVATFTAFLAGVRVGGHPQRAAYETERRNLRTAAGHNAAELFRQTEGM